MESVFDDGQLKSKCGARHCLFCADINDQSHFAAARPGFAHPVFSQDRRVKHAASQWLENCNRDLLFRNRINWLHLSRKDQDNTRLKCHD